PCLADDLRQPVDGLPHDQLPVYSQVVCVLPDHISRGQDDTYCERPFGGPRDVKLRRRRCVSCIAFPVHDSRDLRPDYGKAADEAPDGLKRSEAAANDQPTENAAAHSCSYLRQSSGVVARPDGDMRSPIEVQIEQNSRILSGGEAPRASAGNFIGSTGLEPLDTDRVSAGRTTVVEDEVEVRAIT